MWKRNEIDRGCGLEEEEDTPRWIPVQKKLSSSAFDDIQLQLRRSVIRIKRWRWQYGDRQKKEALALAIIIAAQFRRLPFLEQGSKVGKRMGLSELG